MAKYKKSFLITDGEETTIFFSDPYGYIREERPATKEELIQYKEEINKSIALSKQGRCNSIDIKE